MGERPSISFDKNQIKTTYDYLKRDELKTRFENRNNRVSQDEYNMITLQKKRNKCQLNDLKQKQKLCLDHDLKFEGESVEVIYDENLKTNRLSVKKDKKAEQVHVSFNTKLKNAQNQKQKDYLIKMMEKRKDKKLMTSRSSEAPFSKFDFKVQIQRVQDRLQKSYENMNL